MKNYSVFILVLSILFGLNSCKKDEFHLGKKKFEEIQEWTYKLPYSSDYTGDYRIVPAVDENDNIYFFSGDNGVNDIISLDSNGTARWQITADGDISSRIAYNNDKIFFYTYDENVPCYYFNCYDAQNGSSLWSTQIFSEGLAFALTDDGIILENNFNQNDNDRVCKYDYNGNLLYSEKINDNGNGEFVAVTCSGNEVYLLGEFGNTSVAKLWKFSDNGSGFTFNWTIDTNEDNIVADIAINKNEDVYLITDQYLYSISNSGAINWKTADVSEDINAAGIRKNITITDSSFILASSGSTMYKFSPAGIVSWDVENQDIAYKDYNNAPIIGKNNIYYTVESGGSLGDGVRAINSDGSYFWYSVLPEGNEYASMLHNGNMVFVYKGNVYCIKTEAGGLSNLSPWPKIYYDYGNTCNQK